MYIPEGTANGSWISALINIAQHGHVASPRGMKIHEILAFKTVVPMISPVITIKERNLGYRFMAAEAWWMLSGRNDVKSISPYSKDIVNYSDDGDKFFGAYGPKIVDQLQYVLSVLEIDPDSRQAVINIWRENPPSSKDIPCTLSFQFLIRKNVLHCVASMRSSDIWLGHPYDIFNFSALSFLILLHLNHVRSAVRVPLLTLGDLHLTCGSKHLYDRNYDAAMEILTKYNPKDEVDRVIVFNQSKYGTPAEFIKDLKNAADSPNGALSLAY
jgi:thymidylate synthase